MNTVRIIQIVRMDPLDLVSSEEWRIQEKPILSHSWKLCCTYNLHTHHTHYQRLHTHTLDLWENTLFQRELALLKLCRKNTDSADKQTNHPIIIYYMMDALFSSKKKVFAAMSVCFDDGQAQYDVGSDRDWRNGFKKALFDTKSNTCIHTYGDHYLRY